MLAGQSAFVVDHSHVHQSDSIAVSLCAATAKTCTKRSKHPTKAHTHSAMISIFSICSVRLQQWCQWYPVCLSTGSRWSNNQEFASLLGKEKLNTDSMLSNKIEIFINRIWTHVKECSWRYAGGLISRYIQQDLTLTTLNYWYWWI